MPGLLQTTVSWVLRLGLFVGLSSSADARLIPLADQTVFTHLRALPIGSRNAIQSLNRITSQEPQEDGSPQSKAQLVQRREPDRRHHDPSVLDYREDRQESACAKKIREMFPPVVLPISDLDLDQANMDHRESAVVIALREPHGEIRAIRFDTDTIAEALDMIRLLRTGKIAAVSVLSLGHRPSMFYMFNGVTKEDREACKRERILELLGTCTECEVLEWRSLKP